MARSRRGGAAAPAFHRAHERVFGHADPHAPVEIVNLRVQLRGVRPRVPLVEMAAGAAPCRRASGESGSTAGPPRRACTSARASAAVIAWPAPPSWSSPTRPCSSRRATSPTSTASAISSSSGRRDASRCPDARDPPELSARRGRGHGLRRGAHRLHHVREGDGRLHLRPAHAGRASSSPIRSSSAWRASPGSTTRARSRRSARSNRATSSSPTTLRSAGRGHPPARHPPRPSDLLGGPARRLRRRLPPLLGHRRGGAGQHLAPGGRDLPGGAAPAAEEALRAAAR